MTTDTGLVVSTEGSFSDVISRVTDELKEEGFGVLTRIDMHLAFVEKLGENFRPYAILGACNPTLAYQALTGRPEVGLLLPCNVTVDQVSDDTCEVRILDPLEMLDAPRYAADEGLAEIAREARARLGRVAASISATQST